MVRDFGMQWGSGAWPWKGVMPILWECVRSSRSQWFSSELIVTSFLKTCFSYFFLYDPCHISPSLLWFLIMWCCLPDFHQNTMVTLSSWTPRALNYKHLLPSGWQFDTTGKSSCYQAWWWIQSLDPTWWKEKGNSYMLFSDPQHMRHGMTTPP